MNAEGEYVLSSGYVHGVLQAVRVGETSEGQPQFFSLEVHLPNELIEVARGIFHGEVHGGNPLNFEILVFLQIYENVSHKLRQ